MNRRATDKFESLSDHDILIQHSVILQGLQDNIKDIKDSLNDTLKEKTDNAVFKWNIGGFFAALVIISGIVLDNRASISKNTTSTEVLKQTCIVKKGEVIYKKI